jgi:hypothetical protein
MTNLWRYQIRIYLGDEFAEANGAILTIRQLRR